MMITILRISSVYLITYIISLCGRKSSVQQAGGSQQPAVPQSNASKRSTGQVAPADAAALKAKSGDDDDDFKFQLNIKKSENKKDTEFDDDDEENPLVKLSMKKRKKMAGSMRQRANDAKAAKKAPAAQAAPGSAVASASGTSVMEKDQDQEQDLFGGFGGTSKGVSCYQFEVKKSGRKMKSPKQGSPAQQPAAAAAVTNNKPGASGEKARASAEKQRAADAAAAAAAATATKAAAGTSEKTKPTQRTAPISEKKNRTHAISPAPGGKLPDATSPGSVSRAVSVTQKTDDGVREDSLKEKESDDLKPVEFTTSPMTKR